MEIVNDEKVFKYTLRNGQLFIHEGDAITRAGRRYVHFRHNGTRVRFPKPDEFGVVHTDGPSVWLAGRYDKIAINLLKEFEEKKIVELQNQLNIKKELVKTLEKLLTE